MSNAYYTADLHLGHTNIGCNESKWPNPDDVRMEFDTIEEHDSTLINLINRDVQINDILYILGDFTFKNLIPMNDYLGRIVCENIIFIPGNHDKHLNNLMKSHRIWDGADIMKILPEQNLIHFAKLKRISPFVDVTINSKKIVMCHYPIGSWHHYNKGTWNLHGHCHNKYKLTHSYQLDVGVDSAKVLLGEYRPFSFHELLDIMSNKSIKLVDQHNNERS